MKNLLLYFLALTFFALSCKKEMTKADEAQKNVADQSSIARTAFTGTKKVLLVGIDGVEYDRVLALQPANLISLNLKKGYTGGVRLSMSEQATLSGPGWMSILTGVWTDQHGVTGNDVSAGLDRAKSIFRYVREARPAAYIASVATWAPINQFLANDMPVVDFRNDGGTDAGSVSLASDKIINKGADFVFVHLDNVDEVGHASGFGPAYDTSIMQADRMLGQLLQAVNTRQNASNEQWLVMVVTDHGREPLAGYSHGGQSSSEKTIFIGMNKAGNNEYNTVATGLPNMEFNGLYGNIAQTSVVPTILRYLDVAIQPVMKFSSAPLMGVDGPRKLLFTNVSSGPLYWQSASSGTATIYRNDTSIATLPASQGAYSNTASPGIYTVSIDGSVASVQKNSSFLYITAAWDWYDAPDNTGYFFRNNGTYVKYNKLSNTAVPGYPQPVSNSSWRGLGSYATSIADVLRWNSQKAYVFLTDGRYIRYDMVADSADAGYPLAVTNSSWPGLSNYATKITAIANWGNGKAYFFLTDGKFLRYDIATDRTDAGYPKKVSNANWPGLKNYATKISALLEWNSQYVYFLLTDNTFIKFDKIANASVAGYPKPIDAANLPGVLN